MTLYQKQSKIKTFNLLNFKKILQCFSYVLLFVVSLYLFLFLHTSKTYSSVLGSHIALSNITWVINILRKYLKKQGLFSILLSRISWFCDLSDAFCSVASVFWLTHNISFWSYIYPVPIPICMVSISLNLSQTLAPKVISSNITKSVYLQKLNPKLATLKKYGRFLFIINILN